MMRETIESIQIPEIKNGVINMLKYADTSIEDFKVEEKEEWKEQEDDLISKLFKFFNSVFKLSLSACKNFDSWV